MTAHTCPCGARLWTREELLATGDPMDRDVALAYLTEADGFCADEDDVVPLGYAAEIIRRRREGLEPCPEDCDPEWGCAACCVPMDFPLPAPRALEQPPMSDFHERRLRRRKRNPVFAFWYWRERRKLRRIAPMTQEENG